MDAAQPGERDAPARVVGIGASAGGVDALIRVVRHLPADFGAAICIVLHVPSLGRSLLAPILGRYTDLEVIEAADGHKLRPGRIYVAPNDQHVMVANAYLRLDRGPKENGVRPAVDVMLRSLAAAYKSGAIAVILSGALGDGAAGALAVHRAGGLVMIQDPEDATVASMPERALSAVGTADAVLRAADIGRELARLVEPATIFEGPPSRSHARSATARSERPTKARPSGTRAASAPAAQRTRS